MKTLLKLFWTKTGFTTKLVTFFLIFAGVVNTLAAIAGVEPSQTNTVKVVKEKHTPMQLARIQVAANQVNKYSPYTCNTYMIDESFVSSWDGITVHLVCDNWNRFEVTTEAGRVKVIFKG